MTGNPRHVGVLAFAAGMLVAGVVVPLATRSTDAPATPAAAIVGSPLTGGTTEQGAGPATDPAAAAGAGRQAATGPAGAGQQPAAGAAGAGQQAATGPAGAATGPADATHAGPAAAPSRRRSSASGPTGGPSAVKLTATDVGVTSDSVKLGVVLLDLGAAGHLVGGLGNASADQQQAALQVYIDEANKAGGINGRKIVPDYTKYDPVNGDATNNCNQLTEDDKVFAVISEGVYGAPVLCFTQQHATPLINVGGYVDEYYQRSSGLLLTMQPTKQRSAVNSVYQLDAQGKLAGKTIGVFTSSAGDDDVAAKTGTVPALQRRGYKVAHMSDLSADTGTASSEIPVEVNQMRAAGVNLIFLQTNVLLDTQFVQQADSSGYRPTYVLGDSESNVSDFFLSNMPASFTGLANTVSRTGEQRVGAPEPAVDANCRTVFETATKQQLARGTAQYETTMGACNQIRTFVAAARATGPQLTRARLSGGYQGMGSFPLAYTAGGSFGPGKFDAADFSRPVVADMSCRCWKPAGDFTHTLS